MSDVILSLYQAASRELIAKLVKAGYLQPALCNVTIDWSSLTSTAKPVDEEKSRPGKSLVLHMDEKEDGAPAAPSGSASSGSGSGDIATGQP